MDDVRSEPRTGIWLHPAGTRFDTTRRDDGWHITVYMHQSGGPPGHEIVFTDPAEVEAKIAGLEAQGYAYLPEPKDNDDAWSIGQYLAVLAGVGIVILIGILAFG